MGLGLIEPGWMIPGDLGIEAGEAGTSVEYDAPESIYKAFAVSREIDICKSEMRCSSWGTAVPT